MVNDQYKEKYRAIKVQLDIVRDRSINITYTHKDGSVTIHNVPISCLSYSTVRHFGNIMTFPVTREIEIATWKLRDMGLL